MSAMTPEQRAAWIANMRKILDTLEQHTKLPLPGTGNENRIDFYLWGSRNPRRDMRAIESAVPAEFTGSIPDPDERHPQYVLDGDLDGTTVRIQAYASDIAERKVTGTRVVEDIEWVRLPVEDEAQQAEGTEAA